MPIRLLSSPVPRHAGAQLFFDRGASDAAEPIALADGRRVWLSAVRPNDCAAERDFVGALSLSSRYRRFHFGLRELSPDAARAMTEIDQHHHVAFVARPQPERAAAIVADARYVLRADSADAEFAIAVADAWQGAGLGRALIERLIVHARDQGIERLCGDVLWGNTPMLALLRSLGARLKRAPGDSTVVRAEFTLDGGAPASSPPIPTASASAGRASGGSGGAVSGAW